MPDRLKLKLSRYPENSHTTTVLAPEAFFDPNVDMITAIGRTYKQAIEASRI